MTPCRYKIISKSNFCEFFDDFILFPLTAHDGVFALDDPEGDGVAGGEGGGVRLAVCPSEVPEQVGVLPHEPQQPHHLPLPPPPLVAGLVLHQVGDHMQRLAPIIILVQVNKILLPDQSLTFP